MNVNIVQRSLKNGKYLVQMFLRSNKETESSCEKFIIIVHGVRSVTPLRDGFVGSIRD